MQEPVHTKTQDLQAETGVGNNTGLQVLCHEVERQLNRHYRRVLTFFNLTFADRRDYPLSSEQALMLFCISNGVQDMAQLWQAVEPVAPNAAIILASLYAQGYVCSDRANEALVELTAKGQAVADGLYDLYTYVYLSGTGKDVPDTKRLASMHVSLQRLQKFSRRMCISNKTSDNAANYQPA
ncbi:hypothetical protein [Pseudochrobactrum sp. MP213Fo]|uniref:hypothetical protein n=1 Tax=Pseudochrobactrum sp. MP213Fo TaxID=3022250 RepID=UPI003BA2E900